MTSKILTVVKSHRVTTFAFVIFLIPILGQWWISSPPNRALLVDIYFTQSSLKTQQDLSRLQQSCKKKQPVAVLKKLFLASRLSYKKLAIVSEYFNPYESRMLNGPAVSWAEDGNPDVIIPPHGYQAIEAMLFGEWNKNSYVALDEEISYMLKMIKHMDIDIDRIHKFKDPAIWSSLGSACVRLVSLGITGFDAPASQYSMPEARVTLNGFRKILSFFANDIQGPSLSNYQKLLGLISKADSYLGLHGNFNSFDRLYFIRTFADPIYQLTWSIGNEAGFANKQTFQSINPSAKSMFAEDFINVNFYSPPMDYWINDDRIALGKKLFYDPILSGTRTRSCASCHNPQLAFTDGLTRPLSLDSSGLLTRNTPTLWNSSLQTRQFYDSRADILENQLDEVVHNTREMKGSLKISIGDLRGSEEYRKLFTKAYPKEKDPLSSFNIANAISSYVRSLIGMNARFDQYMRGGNTLSVAEKRGFNLFTGKAKCATCHFIPLFNGLVPPEFTETESEVLGVPQAAEKINAVIDPDHGKMDFTTSSINSYAFKIPTLRNIALTAPYMHNGVYKTLEEVIEFYNNGGGAGLHIVLPNQTLPPEKLNLSSRETADLILFLKALTDTIPRQSKLQPIASPVSP